MCFLIRTAACARTSSRSRDALTSSPISARVATTSGLFVVSSLCVLGSVASMNLLIIAGGVLVAQTPGFKAILCGLCLASRSELQDADIGQIPITFVKVQAVADNKFVGNHKAGVVCAHVGDPPFDLIQQNDDAKMFRLLFLKEAQQVL